MSAEFGRSFSHHPGQGLLQLLPVDILGLPWGVVAEISHHPLSLKQELLSPGLWPGEIRVEMQLSDGRGLVRSPW